MKMPGESLAVDEAKSATKTAPPEPEKPPRKPVTTDPALRMVAKLDRMIAGMEPFSRALAITFLVSKYGQPATGCKAPGF